jgi:predicted ATPase/signal transduction histidine kinase/CheY-like chemotaxis protein/tRNA A-37 threonylcarbamoyl transferase component Bud32
MNLALQSCSNLTNPPIPIKKGRTDNTQEITPQIDIQSIVDKEFTTKGSHLISFCEKKGRLQAKVIEQNGCLSRTHMLPVYIEEGMDIAQVAQLNEEAKKKFIHINLPERRESGYIRIGNAGLKGGSNTDKGKEKLKDDEYKESEDKKLIAQAGQIFSFKQEINHLQAKGEGSFPSIFSKTHDLSVPVEKDLYATKVASSSKEGEKQFTHADLPKNEQPEYIYVDGRGLKGSDNLVLPGYKLLNCLHEGNSSNIYRAVRLSDECPVVIKVSTQKVLTEKKAQRFRREFELGQQIHSPYVVRYLELKQDVAYGIALVMEDDQAVELTSLLPPAGFSNHEFLEIAMQIVQGLQAIHAANIIHSDLKLNNILIHPTTKAIKIIDFNYSSTLRQERNPAIPMMVSTLAYISPEQTGRVNRRVDYRTDFYALGVIFYRLLCGEPPFTAKDPLGLIHQHLAKQPLPPHHCKPTIALPLSEIVMKLLEKEAENRYQSCEGILHDLTLCLSALNETGTIPEFKLGQQDFSSKLTLSQYLYGRESEIKTLLNAFEYVSEGKREALMVAGQPGVGKTMLIQEIQKPIALKQGYFITGKFDQLNKNVAYSALTQAFNGLVQQWLGEDETSITQWKNRLMEALGAQGSLLIKVVPSLALVIGEQPDKSIADMSQAKNVFNWIFQEFVKICATASHPLVIFLDDLQWADQASLELMTYLLQQLNVGHLLWIGAYRDTEITPSHPTLQAIATLQEAQVRVQTLSLASLTLASLSQWVADSLHKPFTDIQPLVELIFQKTGGNPFFVKVFLQSLYDEQLLTFAPQIHWQWDLDKIRQHPATENVITLMIYQIQHLPAATQKALNIASCLGHCLAVSTLQTAMACSSEEVDDALQPALNSGILIQTDSEVHFAHDRVQEAAYDLIAETEKAHTHLTIGKRLLAHFSTKKTLLFDIITQFDLCSSLVTEPEERMQMAHLNLKAAEKTKQTTAYVAALGYLYAIQNWIDTEMLWKTDYRLAFIFYKELAETEYLCGHVDTSEMLIINMQPHLESALDKVNIYHLLIIQKIMQGHQEEAITIGHQALQLVGSGLPLDNLNEFIEKTAFNIKQKLRDKPLFSLLNAPLVTEPEKQAIFKILTSIYSATYLAGTELLLFAVALMLIDLSLNVGHTLESCHSYAIYGLVLCDRFQEYALGYEFGCFALQLADKLQSPVQRCRNAMMMYNHISPWSKSVQYLPTLYSVGFEACLACGEIEYAGYTAIHKIMALFYTGTPLANVQRETLTLLQFAQNAKSQVTVDTIQGMQRLLANLMGDTLSESSFDINGVDEIKFVKHCQQANSFYALCIYYIHKAQVYYLHGNFEQGLSVLNLAKENLTFILGSYSKTISNWYDSLARLALYLTTSNEDQPAYLEQVTQNQQQMQKWQASCSENFAHKYFLVEAELARIEGHHEQAQTYYNQAIELAGQHGFVQEQALAAEQAAQYWLERNNPICAQGYLNIAFNGYKQWGAKRKLLQFKAKYADLLRILAPLTLSPLDINQETTLSGNTLQYLDLSSILKASHTISSEIELPKLLRSIMQIIIENAGAQQGAVLFVEADDTIFVQAEYASDGTMTILQKIPLADWTNGAQAVIQYVKRMDQPVVVDHATTHEQFKMDPYIRRAQAKSILCVPLLKHAELQAILYVENNLLSHAFTPERLQTVLILTAQMAISLENARYVAEQLALTRQLAEQSARRQLAEESLHAVTHDLKLALEASQAGTWNWWIDTNNLTWDPTNCALFGLKPSEFKSTYDAFLERVHPEDCERVTRTLKYCIEQDIPYDIEYRVIWPDDSQHVIAGHGHVYRDKEGRPIKMAGVCLDITQRKQLQQERVEALEQAEEKERQRADDAERYFKQQGEFVDTICHEIRNPMNGISNTVVFLKEKMDSLKTLRERLPVSLQPALGELVQTLEEDIQTIQQCVDHQIAVINGVLNLSRLEAGKEELLFKPFKPKTIIEEIILLFRSQLKTKQLDLIVDFPEQAITIKGDPERFKIVLINFISNAIKFTEKGHIKISFQTQVVDPTHVELIIRVEDTGIGMTPEEQSRLFQQFSRPLSSQYEGSGLGLAISKKLLDLMGGTIQVDSVKGQGSTFTIHLTCEIVVVEEKISPLLHRKMSSPLPLLSPVTKHILVVEDNIVNQKILRRQLEAAGYPCTIANNGQKAIEAIGALEEVETPEQWNVAAFDLILMDLEMPVMGGIEATRLIRKKEKQLGVSSIPIIGLSAYAEEIYGETAKQAGMDAYMTKPHRREELFKNLSSQII